MYITLYLRRIGFGFIFVPSASLTLAGLKGKEISQASGLSNMLQLLGGSVGLAVINTYVTRRIAVHRMDLMPNVSMYNPAASERYHDITQQLMASGKSAEQAGNMAMGFMDQSLAVQSAVISYSEGFMMIGIICAVMIPLIFFAKIKKGESLSIEGVH